MNKLEKGMIINDSLAKTLRDLTSISERKELALKQGIHVNSINNKIVNKRNSLKSDNDLKVINSLCRIAFLNNYDIAARAKMNANILNEILN